MKKIKVAFCLRDMQLGGVESVLIRTIDKLAEYKNIKILVITYANIQEPLYVEYFKTHPNIKCYSLYPCSWLGTKMPSFFLVKIIKHILRDIYRNTNRLLFEMKKFKDIDVFIDYHDFGFYDEFKHIKHAKKIAWFHSSINVFKERNFICKLKRYDKTVVLTDEFIKEFQKTYPNQDVNLVRMYNPIDVEQIKEKSKEKYKKITGDYFCSVARLSWDKDIITLLKGFDLFWGVHKKPDLKLVIVGDGKKADEYKAFANKLKSAKQIVFVGAQKNPFVYMKDAKANILSSFGEGFALVLIESAAVGTLNIASSCHCGPREILLNGKAGLLFEPGNVKALAKCMNDVYTNKVDAKKMTDIATKSLQRFDADKIIKEFISLIS